MISLPKSILAVLAPFATLFLIDDQVFFAPREIFDKAGSKRSVPNEESIVSNYG
jgi:hypothetical protein